MVPVSLLARVGLPRTDSTSAGLLVAASHLGVAYVGSGNLHAARSMPLLLLLMIVWDALMPATPSMLFSGLRIGIILLGKHCKYRCKHQQRGRSTEGDKRPPRRGDDEP